MGNRSQKMGKYDMGKGVGRSVSMTREKESDGKYDTGKKVSEVS